MVGVKLFLKKINIMCNATDIFLPQSAIVDLFS